MWQEIAIWFLKRLSKIILETRREKKEYKEIIIVLQWFLVSLWDCGCPEEHIFKINKSWNFCLIFEVIRRIVYKAKKGSEKNHINPRQVSNCNFKKKLVSILKSIPLWYRIATGGVLKIFANFTGKRRPATLLKRDSNTGVFLKNIYERLLLWISWYVISKMMTSRDIDITMKKLFRCRKNNIVYLVNFPPLICRDIFRTLSNIHDGAFWVNS